MSPANRRNPDHTSILGSFGWDVLPGFYRVAATHSGCQALRGKSTNALTQVLWVPPPALNLAMVLRCSHLRRANTHTTLRAQRAPMHHVVLTALTITRRSPRGFTAQYEGDALNGPSSARG